MATRNKTPTFLKYRDTAHGIHGSDSDFNGEVSLPQSSKMKGGYVRVEMTERDSHGGRSLPPVWVDLSESIKEEMVRIRSKMSELAKVQARALLPSFDSWQNTHEKDIEILTHEITKSLKRCEKDLMRLTDGGSSSDSATIGRNIQRSMATDLQTLSMEFRKQSKSYLKRLEDQKDTTTSKSSRRQEAPESSSNGDVFESTSSESQQRRKVRKGEDLSLEREQEINEIMTSVNELAQIMKDLSVLVIDQGTVVDRIDYNIQNVGTAVNKGLKQLVKAEGTQRRTALISCIMILVAICVALIVILLVKDVVL